MEPWKSIPLHLPLVCCENVPWLRPPITPSTVMRQLLAGALRKSQTVCALMPLSMSLPVTVSLSSSISMHES
jgi:hypothetical protein